MPGTVLQEQLSTGGSRGMVEPRGNRHTPGAPTGLGGSAFISAGERHGGACLLVWGVLRFAMRRLTLSFLARGGMRRSTCIAQRLRFAVF